MQRVRHHRHSHSRLAFTIPEGRRWPGTYTIGEPGEIVTGGPLEYTPDNVSEHQY